MLKQLAGEIHDGSRRLNRVVNNLLDMNRLESGVIRPKQEWCDVRELLQSAIEIERESINGRDVRFDVPENIPLALMDHTLIEQAVAKLLANAASYAPSRLPIEIDAEYKNDQLIISVSDRGPGASRRNRRTRSSKNSTAATAARPAASDSGYRSPADSSKRTAAN